MGWTDWLFFLGGLFPELTKTKGSGDRFLVVLKYFFRWWWNFTWNPSKKRGFETSNLAWKIASDAPNLTPLIGNSSSAWRWFWISKGATLKEQTDCCLPVVTSWVCHVCPSHGSNSKRFLRIPSCLMLARSAKPRKGLGDGLCWKHSHVSLQRERENLLNYPFWPDIRMQHTPLPKN